MTAAEEPSSTESSGPAQPQKKVNRRDPAKRRQQNRESQKTYRQKQRRRIQELERLAETTVQKLGSYSSGEAVPAVGSQDEAVPVEDLLDLDVDLDTTFGLENSTDLVPLQTSPSTRQYNLFSTDFDHWLINPDADGLVYFECGCPSLHFPVSGTRVALPKVASPHMNHLRIDSMCVIAAFLENCVQLGITRPMFCAEEAVSPFFRPQLDSSYADSGPFLTSLQRMFSTIKYDLRPSEAQLTTPHHPYLDTFPFRDIRDNVMRFADEIDEDEFIRDSVNHMTCWGGVAGAHTGSPWDSRSWEADDAFLTKWDKIVGGPDGELARQSRWWRAMRGERVAEIS